MIELLLDNFLKNAHLSHVNGWSYIPALAATLLLCASLFITARFAIKDLHPYLHAFTSNSAFSTKHGSTIEFVGVKELWNGKIVLIPGATSGKASAASPSEDQDHLRQQFYLVVSYSESRQAVKIISDYLEKSSLLMHNKKRPVKIIVDPIKDQKVRLLVTCWLLGVDSKEKLALTKSAIMLDIMNRLSVAAIKFQG